jgi:hypothetical protein
VSLTFYSASSLLKPAPRSSSPTSPLPAGASFLAAADGLAEGFSVSFGFGAGFFTSSN